MEFNQSFIDLALDKIHDEATTRHDEGWRYVQLLAVNLDNGFDLVYSFMKDGQLDNLVVHDVPRDAEVQSITDLFLEAFVCENEIHDLFGVKFLDIAIDFKGNFYKLSAETPMTIISPAQLAEREKAAKIAKAKAAKEARLAKEQAEAEAQDNGESSEKPEATEESDKTKEEAPKANKEEKAGE